MYQDTCIVCHMCDHLSPIGDEPVDMLVLYILKNIKPQYINTCKIYYILNNNGGGGEVESNIALCIP